MRKTAGPLFLALALALPLAACDDSTSPAPAPGAVTVLLNWEPGATLDEAWIEVRSVYLQTADDFTDPPETREYLLRDGASAFDSQQQLGDVSLAGEAEVTPGLYRSLYVVFSEACVLSGEGRPFTSSGNFGLCGREDAGILRLSDGDSASAAVRIGFFEVVGGDSQTVRLDLDVGESFARTESGWIFDPLLTQRP